MTTIVDGEQPSLHDQRDDHARPHDSSVRPQLLPLWQRVLFATQNQQVRMNKYQKGVLIGAGLLITVIQIVGIADNGLDDNPGWVFSFLAAALLFFLGLGSGDVIDGILRSLNLKRSNAPEQMELVEPTEQREVSRETEANKPDTSQEKVLVDILYGAVRKNASDLYSYIHSKGYYHDSGALAFMLRPDAHSLCAGYAVLYMRCLRSEKLRSRPAQISFVRELVIGNATKMSTQSWDDLAEELRKDAGKEKDASQDTVGQELSPKQREIYEDHIASLEAACREVTTISKYQNVASIYVPIYKVISPAFGGSKDFTDDDLAKRFDPIFVDLMQKTENVENAL